MHLHFNLYKIIRGSFSVMRRVSIGMFIGSTAVKKQVCPPCRTPISPAMRLPSDEDLSSVDPKITASVRSHRIFAVWDRLVFLLNDLEQIFCTGFDDFCRDSLRMVSCPVDSPDVCLQSSKVHPAVSFRIL